jgi:hypothetical protein
MPELMVAANLFSETSGLGVGGISTGLNRPRSTSSIELQSLSCNSVESFNADSRTSVIRCDMHLNPFETRLAAGQRLAQLPDRSPIMGVAKLDSQPIQPGFNNPDPSASHLTRLQKKPPVGRLSTLAGRP